MEMVGIDSVLIPPIQTQPDPGFPLVLTSEHGATRVLHITATLHLRD